MAKKLADIAEQAQQLFFGIDVALKQHVLSDNKCVTMGAFLPLVADFLDLSVDSDEFTRVEPLIRYYLDEVEGYKVSRGAKGGVRKLRSGEIKKSLTEEKMERDTLKAEAEIAAMLAACAQ